MSQLLQPNNNLFTTKSVLTIIYNNFTQSSSSSSSLLSLFQTENMNEQDETFGDSIVMVLINVSVLVLGTIGVLLNGFSIHVLWKCITTGELGIKLVLFSDLLVCLFYILGNIQNNIVNHIVDNQINRTHLISLAQFNRSMIHIPLFVSNWWIIILLFLRLMNLLAPFYNNLFNKVLYHKIAYVMCCVLAIAIIIILRSYLRYVRIIIYVIPVILVSIEAGAITYGIRKLERTNSTSSTTSTFHQSSICQEQPNCSLINSFQMGKIKNQYTVKRYTQKPYNHIVITILTLALNFLILDCLQFIDTIHYIATKKTMPAWFMLIINIFSLLKRIMNFVILCAKCRHFRKILKLKLNLLLQPIQRRKMWFRNRRNHNLPQHNINNSDCLENNNPFEGFSHCPDCQQQQQQQQQQQKPKLFAKEDGIVQGKCPNKPGSNVVRCILNNNTYPVNSYCSAFEIASNMSLLTTYPNRLVLSGKF